MTRVEWTTARGARIELAIEWAAVRDRTYTDSGDEVYLPRRRYIVHEFRVNGTPYEGQLRQLKDVRIAFWMQGHEAAAIVPDDIAKIILADETAAFERSMEAGRKQDERRAEFERMMRE